MVSPVTVTAFVCTAPFGPLLGALVGAGMAYADATCLDDPQDKLLTNVVVKVGRVFGPIILLTLAAACTDCATLAFPKFTLPKGYSAKWLNYGALSGTYIATLPLLLDDVNRSIIDDPLRAVYVISGVSSWATLFKVIDRI